MGILFEIAISLIFIFCIYHARKSLLDIYLIFLALIYAVIFENLNVILSAGNTGGYYFSTQFNMFTGHLPLMVALIWAILIYITYSFVNSINIKDNRKAFADAFIITLIDLAIDPVASRMGLWAWIGYGPRDGFFGVPGNNFLGWLLVTFIFMLMFRFIEKKKLNKLLLLLLPVVSYIIFIIVSFSGAVFERFFKFSKITELLSFFVIYLVFLFMIKKDKNGKINEVTLFYTIRSIFYLFFIYFIIYFKMDFIILLNFLIILTIELLIYLRFVRRNV